MKTLSLLLFLFSGNLHAQNTWTQKNSFPGISRDDGVGFSLNGKGFAGTGRLVNFAYANDFWQYNPSLDAWSQVADLPGQPRQYAVAFTINQLAYVVGGTNANVLNDVWQFDEVANQWSQKNNFPGSPRFGAVAFVIANHAFMGTGRNGSNYFNDFWQYEPSTDA